MTERPYDILMVGELNVDIIVSGQDLLPEFGQKEKLVDDISLCAGSSAAIFAAAAARLGLKVLFVSCVGDDLFGRFMLDALRDAGVDTSYVRIDPTIKTGAGIHLSHGHDRATLSYLGSIAAVGPEDINDAYYRQARHLHIASPFLLERLKGHMPEMMRRAHAAGMTVSLDTNWDPEQRWELDGFFEHLDVFMPNEQELLAISGEANFESAMRKMSTRVPVLVVKKGGQGFSVWADSECSAGPAFPVATVDTTGAGDTFDAGFLAGWLRGLSAYRSALLGSACGALTTTQVGGFNGQPDWDKAIRFVCTHAGCDL